MSHPDVHPVVKAARLHVENVVAPNIEGWQKASKFPREAAQAAGEAGLCGMYVPASRGGSELDFPAAAAVFEELGRADALYGLTYSVHNLVTRAVSLALPESAPGRWLEKLCRGEALGTFLMTEPTGGSDPVGAMSTRVTKDGDGWVLNGRKSWVALVGDADVYAVVCRSGDAQSGTRDMMMVLVQADDPGVRTAKVYDKLTGGFFAVGEVEFDNVRLDADRVLAPAGEAFRLALATIDIARLNVAAGAVGLSSAALDIALESTSRRTLFGSRVLDMQAVQYGLADVETSIHVGRLLYRQAAELMHQPGGSIAAAHAKRFCPDAALDAALTCSRVMGANGALSSGPMPRLLVGAQHLTMADGAPDVQRLVIGRTLMDRAAQLGANVEEPG